VVKDNRDEKVNFSYRDNLWQGSDLLATGIASFGHASGVHYQNIADMAKYQSDLMEKNQLPLGRAFRPSPDQLLIREMILQLKRGYLDVGYFRNKFDVDITQRWAAEFGQHAEDGMLTVSADRIELTRKGFLHADALLPVFFETDSQGIRYT
jgi:oxygen-independent coproporphyrinogen-3 oxidase